MPRPIAQPILPQEARVLEVVRQLGPLEAFRHFTAENDALARSSNLNNGRELAADRTAIHTALMRHWAEQEHRNAGYDRPFAVVALGGTGRGEMAPASDIDFAFLFEDPVEQNPFLLELQKEIVHSRRFESKCGYGCMPLPFSLDDIPHLSGKQLNSFLDMRAVYDPTGLSELFRQRIREVYNPFEHFLHVRGFWKDQWEKAAGDFDRLDRFDIKNDALRVFLAGVWTLGGKRFLHSHLIYETLEDQRALEAYAFLMRIRAFAHATYARKRTAKGGGNHPEDELDFDTFLSFGEMLGPDSSEQDRFEFSNEVRSRLIAARRRVARFARGIIDRELKFGREVEPRSPIVYGTGGLYFARTQYNQSAYEKSRAALALLLASQRYSIPVDSFELHNTFRDAGDWLTRVPELSALFYEQRGSLADSFTFLSQLDGAEDRLFPGYARFESSLDSRVMKERRSLRGVLEKEKLRALEGYVREGRARLAEAISAEKLTDPTQGIDAAIQSALLDAEHLAAVKLALKTKRLPLTRDDVEMRKDDSRPLHERFSTGFSEIPLGEYFTPYATLSDFSRETIRIAEFLIANRRAFKERAEAGINDDQQVQEFARLCQNEQLLRALFVFTCADRAEWESQVAEPARWFNTRELYAKTLMHYRPVHDPTESLRAAGYSPEELAILKDFGQDFFAGVYRQYANRFGAHLVQMAEHPETTPAKACVLRDATATIIGVAAKDYRGLAAAISGAFWHRKIELTQAHLFSAMNHGLALDFFHLPPSHKSVPPDLMRFIEDVIQRQAFIGEEDEKELPRITGKTVLREWRPRLFCMRSETTQDVGGLIYALSYKIFRHLEGNIFGLAAHAPRGKSYVSVYHSLPPSLDLERARALVAERF